MYMRACAGVLSIKPGGGKTLITSALIQSYTKADASPEDLTRMDPFRLTNVGGNIASIPISYNNRDIVTVLDTTLVVVGSVLGNQWRNTLVKAGIPASEVYVCIGTVANKLDVNNIAAGKYKVLVVSNFLYRELLSKLRMLADKDRTHEVKRKFAFWRIVIDEADSLAIPNFIIAPTRFLWLVTGTPSGLGKRKYLRSIIRQLNTSLYVATPATSNALPDVVYKHVMPIYSRISELYINGAIDMGALVGFQKAVHERTKPPPSLIKRCHVSEVKMRDSCCLTFKHAREFSDVVSMHCCSGIVSGKYLARHVEVHKEMQRAPLCRMCGAMIGPAIVAGLPAPVDTEAYWDVFESLHPIIATRNVLKTLMESETEIHAGSSNPGPRIIIFKESSFNDDVFFLNLAEEHEYRVLTINRYTKLDETLEEFAKGRALLILNSDHAQGINVPMGDVIILTHTVTPEVFRQLVCRARRPPRTELVRVFHLQLGR
jgi:hypothetical protein